MAGSHVVLSLLVIFAFVHTSVALTCHQCDHYSFKSGDKDLNKMLEGLLKGDKFCSWKPGHAKQTEECDGDDVCGTSFMTFQINGNFSGQQFRTEADILIRGCSDEELGCHAYEEGVESMIMEELKKANITDVQVTDAKGGECACDKDKCNRDRKMHIPVYKKKCVSCTWVEAGSSSKQEEILDMLPGLNKTMACVDDPRDMEYEYCDEDSHQCVTMVAEVQDFGDVSGAATIWRRGCARKNVLKAGCHNITKYREALKDLVGEMVDEEDFTTVTRGGVCACDRPGCNKDDHNKAWRAAGAGTMCSRCSYLSAKNNQKEMRALFPKHNTKCQSKLDEVNMEECDQDEVCASVYVPIMEFEDENGDDIEITNGKLYYRGCVSRATAMMPRPMDEDKGKKGDHRGSHSYSDSESREDEMDYEKKMSKCHNSRHFEEFLEEIVPDELEVDELGGGVCFCDGNGCNYDSLERLEESNDLIRCAMCSYVESNRKTGKLGEHLKDKHEDDDKEMDRMCMDGGDKTITCLKTGQMCASLMLDTSRFRDIHKPSRMWIRGCIDQLPVADGCRNVVNLTFAGENPLLGNDDYDTVSGAMCFCNGDDCNKDHRRADMMEAAKTNDCAFDCKGMANGWYNKCGDKCKRGIMCRNDEIDDEEVCDKREQWDNIEKACLSASATCPTWNKRNKKERPEKDE